MLPSQLGSIYIFIMVLKLTLLDLFSNNGRIVYINYDNVNYFLPTEYDNNTIIYFKDGSKIYVKESSEDINKILLTHNKI